MSPRNKAGAFPMEELPGDRPPAADRPLLDTPASREAAAPEPGEEEQELGRQSWWKDLSPKYAMLIAVICLLVGGGIGFILRGAFQGPSCPPSCPNKWLRSDEKCYFVSQESKIWNSSLEFCKTHGGTLLFAGNETQEIGSLHNLVGEDYWIGLKKDTVSGVWRQLDGAEWLAPIEHDNAKMSCGCINSGKYVALDCSTPRRWICVLSL